LCNPQGKRRCAGASMDSLPPTHPPTHLNTEATKSHIPEAVLKSRSGHGRGSTSTTKQRQPAMAPIGGASGTEQPGDCVVVPSSTAVDAVAPVPGTARFEGRGPQVSYPMAGYRWCRGPVSPPRYSVSNDDVFLSKLCLFISILGTRNDTSSP
jgi:hypothetical protein